VNRVESRRVILLLVNRQKLNQQQYRSSNWPLSNISADKQRAAGGLSGLSPRYSSAMLAAFNWKSRVGFFGFFSDPLSICSHTGLNLTVVRYTTARECLPDLIEELGLLSC
jgi:hypothetical protein